MALSQIQQHLHKVYDIDLDYRVEDYLVTDRAFVDRLTQADPARATPEKLLFTECDGELLVSLYLAEELVESLRDNNPYDRLDPVHLAAFCTALEGVSHFVYLVYNASHERPVSQLELELQAEVDKFFLVRLLSEAQGTTIDAKHLSRWLFDDCRFDPGLGPPERWRYETANRLARAFCNRVGYASSARRADRPVYKALRRFYRKRHLDKVESALGRVSLRAP
ncbi:MAG: hypothetical protein DWQ08_11375 [Proteobacteria bacterium]|nr:MAG: hypothetical protein DWQ08_11375 [Pseudomonadota bacterium]